MKSGNINRGSAILVLGMFAVFSVSDIGFCLQGGIFCIESSEQSEGCHPAIESGDSCHPTEVDGIDHSRHTDHCQSCEQAIPGRHEHQKHDYSLPGDGRAGTFSPDPIQFASYIQDTVSFAGCFFDSSTESERPILISLRSVIMVT